ncbi:MAG: hypothetical protein Q4E05_11050 [Pseudoclavibacter sp.]|nr:hypothetical protein [Pseudoclavibacter sp.]
MIHRRLTRAGAVCAAAALSLAVCQGAVASEPDGRPAAEARETNAHNPFDALYPADFSLSPLSADPIAPAERPARAQGLDDAFIDPAYGTRIYRATDGSEGQGERMRHNYSRRQAFNADASRYIAWDDRGYWYLYDGASFQQIKLLKGLAGDCEPIWHASDPNVLYFTARDGGSTWWSYDVRNDKTEVLFDFAGKTPWPQATSFWTGKEGTASADGRYLALMATSYDAATQQKKIYGMLTFDLQEQRIVGTLDAKDFPVPHAYPDHISISPSGEYVVPSWLHGQGGTRAYPRDFSSSVELATGSEHSDLVFGPEGQDYYVYADYGSGKLVAVDIASRQRIELRSLYPAGGEAYALHISGQAFDKPGWAVVSTYADSADYAQTSPAPQLRAEYRKVWLVELKPGGRVLNVAHVRAQENPSTEEAYFLEPHASASRDLSRIIFTSNFGSGPAQSYIVGLPSWAVE